MQLKQFINILLAVIFILITLFVNDLLGIILFLIYILLLIYQSKAALYSKKGAGYYAKGNIQAALKYYSKACNTKTPSPPSLISYILLLLKTGDVVKADNEFKRIDENILDTYNKYSYKCTSALLLWKKGNVSEAEQIFDIIIKEFKNTTLYGCAGSFYLKENKLDKAIELNEEAYNYNNENQIISDNLARTYYLVGEKQKANDILDNLISKSPTIKEPFINKALILIENNQVTEALSLIEQSEKYPLSKLSYFTNEEINEIVQKVKKKNTDSTN